MIRWRWTRSATGFGQQTCTGVQRNVRQKSHWGDYREGEGGWVNNTKAVWRAGSKGRAACQAFALDVHVISAQLTEGVGDEFGGDFFAPGHVEVGVVERLGYASGESGSLGDGVVI